MLNLSCSSSVIHSRLFALYCGVCKELLTTHMQTWRHTENRSHTATETHVTHSFLSTYIDHRNTQPHTHSFMNTYRDHRHAATDRQPHRSHRNTAFLSIYASRYTRMQTHRNTATRSCTNTQKQRCTPSEQYFVIVLLIDQARCPPSPSSGSATRSPPRRSPGPSRTRRACCSST